MEGVIQKHDDFCAVQKRQLNDVKEEYHEKLKVSYYEKKKHYKKTHYSSSLACNTALEAVLPPSTLQKRKETAINSHCLAHNSQLLIRQVDRTIIDFPTALGCLRRGAEHN